MRTKPLLLMSIILFLCNAACKKISQTPAAEVTINYNSADVYVAGTVTIPVNGGFTRVAAYWKDSTLTILGDGQTISSASGIAVLGSDVYVAGTIQGDSFGTTRACLWKNGEPTVLSPDSAYSEATCIALRGSDVLVGGAILDKTITPAYTAYIQVPVYWDNGASVKIPGAQFITSMAVSGTDVYLAGAFAQPFTYVGEDTLGGGDLAAYWKNNGPAVLLAQPSSSYAVSALYGIAASGQNVYATGFLYPTETDYWDNSNIIPLSQSNYNANASSIAVSGNDVYIGGNLVTAGYPTATYWKNNVATILSSSAINSSAHSQVNAIAVNGSDVYAAGWLYNTATLYNAAIVWKNGIAVQLSNGGNLGAEANAIYIVPK